MQHPVDIPMVLQWPALSIGQLDDPELSKSILTLGRKERFAA